MRPPPTPPPPSSPPGAPAFASCAAIKFSGPSSTSGVYTINPGAGLLSVFCDMETDGGGWTLVANRVNNGTNSATDELVDNSTLGTAVQDVHFDALKNDAAEIMVQFTGEMVYNSAIAGGGGPPCVIADVSEMQAANCVAFNASTSILDFPLAHHENSGCGGLGADYTTLGGTPDSAFTRQTCVFTYSSNSFGVCLSPTRTPL